VTEPHYETLELRVPEEERRRLINPESPATPSQVAAIRERVDETWRRDVFNVIGRAGHPDFAHDCYDCAARDRARLLAALDALRKLRMLRALRVLRFLHLTPSLLPSHHFYQRTARARRRKRTAPCRLHSDV
jgi:hypothetical protein